MKEKGKKSLLMLAVLSCNFWSNQQIGLAAENLQEFVLDPMVVTAQGFATKDLDTPALVEVFNEKEIEDSGANNAYDVLQDTLGVTASSYGFNGTNQGTMTSKIMIRGVQDGTLVLVDGVPMNMDGRYNLDDIPSDAIERIEVVKGGGSVLYGSEATGGVINIITKKQLRNRIKFAAGNYGKERYDISVGAGKFNLLAGLENRGKADDIKGLAPGDEPETENVYDYGKGERQSIRWNYLLSDGLTFTHAYSENENKYLRRKAALNTYNRMNQYTNIDNSFLLNYDKNGWQAFISYGTQEKDNDQVDIKNSGERTYTENYNWRKGHNTNLKLQKQFDIGKDKLLVGVSYQKEDMDTHSALKSSSPEVDSNLRRDNYSIFLSYDMALGEQSNFILNMRETWVTKNEGRQREVLNGTQHFTKNDDLSKFTPEAEYIYRINEESSVYAKAGKSFKLPTMSQIYGSGVLRPALDLKPEEGTHYEIGYKLNAEKSAWRIALFNYEVKDSVEAVESASGIGYDYFNKDVRNTGIEVALTLAHNNNWTSRWGVTYHNSQARDNNPKGYGDKAWHDYGSRYQFNGALSYVDAKFSSTIKANFVGDRTSDTKEQRHIKPQLFTDWHFSYQPEENHKVFLHINNILDRRDIVSTGNSNYYNLGRNFMLGYEYLF